jgi:NAD-dependent SIR2 family protein deacetylase
MGKHHLINEINQRIECPYCHDNLQKNEWVSLFVFEHHYKETECNKCSKQIRLKVNFHGSGHDCWDYGSEFSKFIGKPLFNIKRLEEKVNENL